MYGSWGVKKGILPFMPGAICTTYKGRVNIKKVAESLQNEHGGKLVYGDTDSCYTSFPHIKSVKENWDNAEDVSNKVSALFPPPMRLEFEKKVYVQFLILTMKRYMYKSCEEDGIIDKDVGKRGVLLSRRDCSLFIRNLFQAMVEMIFDRKTYDEVIYYLMTKINELMSRSLPDEQFIITKSVGDVGNFFEREQFVLELFQNEKNQRKGRIGAYIVEPLPTDEHKRQKKMKLKEAKTEKEYYEKCLPAQVQLSLKIKRRGGRVGTGSRIKYVITEMNGAAMRGKQYDKIEEYDYFVKLRDVLKIDLFYYLHSTIKPFDQVLNVWNKQNNDFMQRHYKFRFKCREAVINELKNLYTNIVIQKEPKGKRG